MNSSETDRNQSLKEMLNSKSTQERIRALQNIIIQMSLGTNMSGIFQEVIKCLSMPSLKVKKLIYLYIINNSQKSPDDALMIINQFCRDARSKNPFVRALAIRTMGYLRVGKLNEYLIDALVEGLGDESEYVQKTAINCVAKVNEKSSELIKARKVEQLLMGLVEEGSWNVRASSLLALRDLNI